MSSIQGVSPVQGQVSVQQVAQGLTQTQQMAAFQAGQSKGIDVVQDTKTKSYYVRIPVQFSAGQGEAHMKVDAKLATAILGALKTGGRISHPEVLAKVMPQITDGGRYGDAEAVLARLLLSSTDDRKVVKINGTRINITDKAEGTLKHELASFWGKLGAKARWDKDPADTYLQGVPTGQTGQQGPILYILPPTGQA